MSEQRLTHSRRDLFVLSAASAALAAVPFALAAEAVEPEPVLALITAFRAAEIEHDAVTDAVSAAYGRLAELGGEPAFPRGAVYREEEDHALGFYGFAQFTATSQEERIFPPRSIRILRELPRQRVAEVRRPATIEDGFTQEEIDSGVNSIVRHVRGPWPEAQVRADEIVAAWDEYQAARAGRRKASGLDVAQAAEAAAFERYKAARLAVATCRVTSMAGVQAKIDVALTFFDGDEDLSAEIANPENSADMAFGLSIIRDLVALRGTAQ